MSRSIIIFGQLNKRYILPFLLALTQIILIIVNNFFPEKETNIVFHDYTIALGQMSIKFVPYILKISDKEEKKVLFESKQKKCLHYFLLCFLFIMDVLIKTVVDYLKKSLEGIDFPYSDSNLLMLNDLIMLSLEMIFMVCISRLLLKYQYFKHHLISILFFIILGIICEIILQNYSNIDKNFILIKFITIINVAVDALYYCYQKYMMEKIYYPYWNIAFIPGVFIFCVGTILLIYILADPLKENSTISIIASFYLYFQEAEPGKTVGRIIIELILHIILCPLSILNVYYFNPSFILIIFQLSTIANNLIKKPTETLYCIPLIILQFIVLMIHLEILELNFCGLNKYTKRNIINRGKEDVLSEGRDTVMDDKGALAIDKDYYIKEKDKEISTELAEKFSSEECFSFNSVNINKF